MARAKTIEDYKAISLNVMQANMEITDQFYSVLNDDQVHERISNIGRAAESKTAITDQNLLSLLQEFLSWKEIKGF